MEKIIQQKISADHLLYVSLKYTKTTDVMLNLITRWKELIEETIERLLEKAKTKRKISKVPELPKLKLDKVREIYKKNPEIIEALQLYEFFKRVDKAEKTRESEFRKHITLKVLDKEEWISIDMDKLKEYSEIIDRFVDSVRKIL